MADGEEPGDVQRPVAEDADSIWRNDAIPVRNEPLDIVWAKRPASNDDPVSPAPPPSAFQPLELAHGDAPPERHRRSKLLIAGGVLVTLAIVVSVMVRAGGDEAAVPGTTTEATGPSTTSDAPATTEDPTDRGAAETAGSTRSVTPIETDLPPTVAAIQAPTEVVALTTDGDVRTLSLPSGRVRSVALAESAQTDASMFGGSGIVVAPEATALVQPDGSRLVIVPRTGPPVTVGVDELGSERGGLQVAGWWRAVDGAERFVVVIYPPDGSSPTYVSVGVGGDVVPLVVPRAVSAGLGLSTPDGTWIVNDAGGAYEVDPSGTSRRIDTGVVQAAARDHRVVRECDDSLRCSTVLVRISDGQRRVVDPVLLPADFDAMSYGMSLSPDGSAVSIVRSGPTQERVIIDLDAGEVAGAPTGYWPQGSTWAADSSGIFDVATDGPGLQFIARTGETVAFGEELGQVIALGVRWPDAEVDPSVTVVSEPVSAARPIGPTGITLVGAMANGGMTYIDIDAGVAQSWATTERLGRDVTLIKSADAILAFGEADEPAFAFRQGTQEPLDAVFATDGLKLPGPVEGTIWVPAPEPGTSPTGVAYRLVTIDGLAVESGGATIDLPDADLLGSDGRGGLVVRRAGDVFAVGVGGADRLTTGELVAIGADTVYVRKCSDIDTCDVTRVDRQSGARSTTDGGFDPESLSAASSPLGAGLGTSVSPDGEVLLVRLPVATTGSAGDTPAVDGWFLADTARGRLTFVDAFDAGQPVIWSADSNFAAVLADSTLLVFDRAAGELVPLSAPRIRAIGSAASPWPEVPED